MICDSVKEIPDKLQLRERALKFAWVERKLIASGDGRVCTSGLNKVGSVFGGITTY